MSYVNIDSKKVEYGLRTCFTRPRGYTSLNYVQAVCEFLLRPSIFLLHAPLLRRLRILLRLSQSLQLEYVDVPEASRASCRALRLSSFCVLSAAAITCGSACATAVTADG